LQEENEKIGGESPREMLEKLRLLWYNRGSTGLILNEVFFEATPTDVIGRIQALSGLDEKDILCRIRDRLQALKGALPPESCVLKNRDV